MSLLLPDAGLLFWMLLAFGVVFVVLYKFGFPVITRMIDARKKYIDDALNDAKEANARLAGIEKQCNELLDEARDKQAQILREAVATREQIVKDAHEKAEAETGRMLAEAKRRIEQERDDALNGIRDEVARLSVAIAEKIMRDELSDAAKQKGYIERLVDETMDDKAEEDSK